MSASRVFDFGKTRDVKSGHTHFQSTIICQLNQLLNDTKICEQSKYFVSPKGLEHSKGVEILENLFRNIDVNAYHYTRKTRKSIDISLRIKKLTMCKCINAILLQA